ncbi:MAG TPA: DinB family protein [Longimicrobiales bacterium]
MKRLSTALSFAVLFAGSAGAAAFATPVSAQARAAAPAAPSALTADMLRSIDEVQEKLTGLGNALSAEQYAWRPMEGVRSAGEVLMHVAADNYLLPVMMGVPAPAATKITADYKTAQAFEQQKLDKAATLAALAASFDHLEKAVASVPESRMNDKLQVFGQEMTVRGFLLMSTTHLSEHLGQMIAYSRSNKVTPPWSR